jgi:hypothetical protein
MKIGRPHDVADVQAEDFADLAKPSEDIPPTDLQSCPYRELDSRIAVMQAVDHGLGDDATKLLDSSGDRRILA